MNSMIDHRLLAAAAELLADAEQLGHAGLERRLDELSNTAPGASIRLLAEADSDGSVHFDAQIRQPDGTTVSVGVVRDDALPWPLRGASRLRDRDLVSVNGVVVTVEQAIQAIDFAFDDVNLLRHVVDGVLLSQAIERAPHNDCQLDDARLEHAVEAFRRGKRLCDAETFGAWLDERSLTEEGLFGLVEDQVRIAAFRRHLERSGDSLRTWLAEQRASARIEWCWGNAARTDKVVER